jgi:NAD-dependent dihydropyrimidine dehydrogenase PreA subunit
MSSSQSAHRKESHSANNPGSQEKKLSLARVEIDADLCKECGLCVEACPVSVLRISERLNIMGYHPVEYIGKGCTGCGICFYVCPEPGTIKVYKENKALE